jgi:hypothetical protein
MTIYPLVAPSRPGAALIGRVAQRQDIDSKGAHRWGARINLGGNIRDYAEICIHIGQYLPILHSR